MSHKKTVRHIPKAPNLYVIEERYRGGTTYAPLPDTFHSLSDAKRGLRDIAKRSTQLHRIAIYSRTLIINDKGKPRPAIICEDCGADAGGIDLPRGWEQYGKSAIPNINIASHCPSCSKEKS